ncbi:MAG: DUF177 domain-containing protein [Prevotellaceae bacterium]|jgi:uncharacterized metal-binding protein YceD (DUF177 family)|nr:DUF177 domain-containing protein [Prevotellaceae bacterium]
MSEVRNYIRLPLRNLEKGKHTFDVSVDTDFFSDFRNSEIIEGSVEISLEVEKFSYFMNVVLSLSGTLTVACDRCLEDIDIPVEDEYLLSVRFGEAPKEPEDANTGEDVMYVNAEDDEIDLTVYIYESICLALPIQRVHGDDDNGNSLCNPEMLKYIINN